jgi:hypothetical protein
MEIEGSSCQRPCPHALPSTRPTAVSCLTPQPLATEPADSCAPALALREQCCTLRFGLQLLDANCCQKPLLEVASAHPCWRWLEHSV